VKQLQYSLQCSHQQSSILRIELQHRCDQVEELTKDHNALLTKFRELTVLMSEAHNKLNTAVAQSGKAMAKDHTKVQNRFSISHCHVSVNGVRSIQTKAVRCNDSGCTVANMAKRKQSALRMCFCV